MLTKLGEWQVQFGTCHHFSVKPVKGGPRTDWSDAGGCGI